MTTTASGKAKKGRTKVVSSVNLGSSEIDPPISTRKARKRKTAEEEDELWDTGALGSGRGDGTSPPQAPNDGTLAAYAEPETDDQTYTPNEQPSNPAPPAATNQKKRGRKKKTSQTQESPPNTHHPTPQAAEACPEPPSEPVQPSTKRKRGRPRKSDPGPEAATASIPPQAQPYAEADASADQQPLSELPYNSQPQSEPQPPDVKKEKGGDDGETKENTQPPATEVDIKHAANTKDEGDEKREKQEPKQNGKPVSTKPSVVGTAKQDQKGPPQKVRYRVGLSKRSRIAPLLKSLKKP